MPGLTQDAVRPGQEFVYRFRADQAGHVLVPHARGLRPRREAWASTARWWSRRGRRPATGLDLTRARAHARRATGRRRLGRGRRADGRRRAPPVRLRLINTDDVPPVFALAGTRVPGGRGRRHRPASARRGGRTSGCGCRPGAATTWPSRCRPTPVDLLSTATAGRSDAGRRPGARRRRRRTAGRCSTCSATAQPAATAVRRRHRSDRRFTLVLDRGLALVDGRPGYAYTVNGRGLPGDPDRGGPGRATWSSSRSSTAAAGPPVAPARPHVLVLSRDGRRPTGSPLWLDTFDVRPGEVWQVAFRADNPGLWMNHCHNLAHADKAWPCTSPTRASCRRSTVDTAAERSRPAPGGSAPAPLGGDHEE